MEKIVIPDRVGDPLPCAKRAQNIVRTADGREYRYTQYLPSRMREGLPLVVEIHGGSGTGESSCARTAWAELAERENFVVVYPTANAPVPDGSFCQWRCQQPDYEKDADYIMEIIDIVCEKYQIDRSRIYVSGMSLGDMMGIIFTAKYGSCIAGLCSFNGPTRPEEWEEKIHLCAEVPVIQIRGELDATLPIPGGSRLPEEEALLLKRQLLIWNRERWIEKNQTEKYPKIHLGEKLNYARYPGSPCDVWYVECRGMGHVQPMYGMELAWRLCFSRYRRTKNGIVSADTEQVLPDAGRCFAVAANIPRAYTASGVLDLDTAPLMGEPKPLPADLWCTVCEEDYSRAEVLYAPLKILAGLLGGSLQDNMVQVETGSYEFFGNTYFVNTSQKQHAMERPALMIEDVLWVPVKDALYVLGYTGEETDGVVFCEGHPRRPVCLTRGFAALLRGLLEDNVSG